MLSWWLSRRIATSLRVDGFARFTSVVSIASIAMGTLALILSISILTGYEERILDVATRFTSHVEIRSDVMHASKLNPDVLQRIRSLPDVKHLDAVIIREALARTRTGVDGVAIHGMEDQRIERLLRPVLTSGLPPTNGSCVLGIEVSRRLNAHVGDTLLLYVAHQDQQAPILFAVPVSGIVTTGMYSVDASLVVMKSTDLAMHAQLDATQPTMISLELHDPERAQRVAIKLLTTLPRGLLIYTWQDRYANVASWIELQKQPIPIVLGLISIVAAFTVLSTLLVAVVLKTTSLAILAAMGLPPRQLMLVVFWRGLRIGIVGTLIGSVVALLLITVQNSFGLIRLDGAVYYVTSLPVSLAPAPFLLVPCAVLFLSALASVTPMLIASRVSIVRALKFS